MKFPTIAELLDSPELKPWVDRASRNVLVTSVKSFVGRVTTELQTRATEMAGDMKIPSASDLAARIAAWLANRQAQGPHAEINATGIVLTGGSLPLADEALHALAALRDYGNDGGWRGQRAVGELARQLTGADESAVYATHGSALLAALAACRGGSVVVARGQVGELESGLTLPQIARNAGVTLRECGTVDGTSLPDYEEAAIGAAAILYLFRAGHDPVRNNPQQHAMLLGKLAPLAKRHQIPLIVHLGWGGIVDPARYGLEGVPHAAAVLAAGADLVVLAGDRLLGGPDCGVVLGRRVAIQKLQSDALFHILAATPQVLLALGATLELHQDLDTAERAVPVLSLLSTSLENLKNRAERLAPQISASPFVASATIVESSAWLAEQEALGQRLKSFDIVVEPKNITLDELTAQLSGATGSVRATKRNGMVHINLRTVMPRQDSVIADAFAAPATAAPKADVEPPTSA